MLSSLVSFLFPTKKGQSEDNALPLKAVPGLITLLDVALFRSVEGQLTGTISTSHTLLLCWLDIKHEAQTVLQLYKEKQYLYHCSDGCMSPYETLGWLCLESACNAIERLSTDRLAAAANLSDAYESTKGASGVGVNNSNSNNNNNANNSTINSNSNSNLFYHQNTLTGVGVQGIRNAILDSNERCETGRRQPTIQRPNDLWESSRLYCPDFVWADDVYFACQKWIKYLDNHPLIQISNYIKHRDDPFSMDASSILTLTTTKTTRTSQNNAHQGGNIGSGSGSNKSTKGSAGSKSRASSRNNNNNNNNGPNSNISNSNYSSDHHHHHQRGGHQQHRRRRKQEQQDDNNSNSKEQRFPKPPPPRVTQRRNTTTHHRFSSKANESCRVELEHHVLVLVKLIQHDLPLRLYQFKAAMDAEAVVTKRLYLVKCEYRAPFRAFLEAHQNLLKAPPMALVDCYLNKQQKEQQTQQQDDDSSYNNNNKKNNTASNNSNNDDDEYRYTSSPEDIKAKLQSLLGRPELVELLSLEMEAEKMELDIGKALFPFSELARIIVNKRVRLDGVPGVVELHEIPALRETIRRLAYVLCRTVGSETSTGIRPIFLDLLMVPRDDEVRQRKKGCSSPNLNNNNGLLYHNKDKASFTTSSSTSKNTALEDRVDQFLAELTILSNLVKKTLSHKTSSLSSSSSSTPSSSTSTSTYPPALNFDIGLSMAKGCTEQYDPELLKCQFLDWFDIVHRQHRLHEKQCKEKDHHYNLPDEIRRTEMKLSIAGASDQSLKKIKEQLEMLVGIKKERFDILKEMVEEVCLREMNLHVSLSPPKPQQVLELKGTTTTTTTTTKEQSSSVASCCKHGLFGTPLLLAGEVLPIG